MDASTLGFIFIVVLYAMVGFGGAVGCIAITQKFLRPKWEQVTYASFLIVVAAAYLAFAAYFRADGAWTLETRAVIAFTVLALIGMRMSLALIVAYPLHGVWDALHELQAHGGYAAFGADTSTPIPVAYGVLCAAFDFAMAGYFIYRRRAWGDDWRSGSGVSDVRSGSTSARPA